MSYFPGYQLKQWQFTSGSIPLNGTDYGAEFVRGSDGFPPWLPSPVLLVGVHLGYIEGAGCGQPPLNGNSYGFMSLNTDPGCVWKNAGGSPQNQSVPESPHALDLGRLKIYAGGKAILQQYFPAPYVLNDNDGLVLDQIGYGGGGVQCIWHFIYIDTLV